MTIYPIVGTNNYETIFFIVMLYNISVKNMRKVLQKLILKRSSMTT